MITIGSTIKFIAPFSQRTNKFGIVEEFLNDEEAMVFFPKLKRIFRCSISNLIIASEKEIDAFNRWEHALKHL